MAILPPTDETIRRAAALLKAGGIVSFPTETVYGLGAAAFNAGAVARIFEAKKRPFFDPLILHIAEITQLDDVAAGIPEAARRIARRFWPGPLTLVLRKKPVVPDIVTAGLGTVAVRMPRHEVARRLIETCGCPIAAPSANRFGSMSPTEAAHVEYQLGNSVDMIIDGGRCEVGIESTILKVEEKSVTLLRPGGIPLEELESEAGHIGIGQSTGAVEAPGQLPYHYSPATPVRIVEMIGERDADDSGAALLYFRDRRGVISGANARVLSATGDLREAAANFFSMLHELDRLGKSVIIAETVPERDLGLAIMDRLVKASKKTEGGP